jgi:acyl-coenzyme A thioesterase PaaI-like protein
MADDLADMLARRLGPRHNRWLPGEVPPAGKRAALHRLAEAMRQTVELLMDTDADEEQLERGAAAIEAFREELAKAPGGRTLWGFAESSNAGDASAAFDNSPLVGLANPIAPPLRLHVDGDTVRGTAVFGQQYEGPPGHVHGGIVAAAFDELLGMVQSLTGNPGMTGRLVVHYRKPTPLGRELRFTGWVERVDGRKIFTAGSLHDGDTLCAESEGLFISVGMERFRSLADGA